MVLREIYMEEISLVINNYVHVLKYDNSYFFMLVNTLIKLKMWDNNFLFYIDIITHENMGRQNTCRY